MITLSRYSSSRLAAADAEFVRQTGQVQAGLQRSRYAFRRIIILVSPLPVDVLLCVSHCIDVVSRSASVKIIRFTDLAGSSSTENIFSRSLI